MASRRLAISSLLCDDDPPAVDPPEPVVLAPHLKNHNRERAHRPYAVGLEALVHAATEERRRLSAGSPTDQDLVAIHEPYRRSPSHQPPEFYSRPLEHSRIQSPFSPHPPRHRDRLIPDDTQVRSRPVDDIHHRPAYFPPPPLSSHPDHEVLIQQQQQLELIRQRQHHEQLLLKEQQQQRQLARERQLAYPTTSTSPTLPPPPRVPSMPLHLQLPSPSFSHPQLSPHAAARNSDPDQLLPMISQKTQTRPTSAHLNLILSSNSPVPDDPLFHPIKKPRYSDSPVPPVSSEEREQLSPDREMAATADSAYQRVDPLVVAIPPRSPTQLTSVHEWKPTPVVELVISDREKEKGRIHVGALESQRDGQGLLKPVGRRASPGSQAGKAKAAKKSEEKDTSLGSKDRISTDRERHRMPEGRQTPGEERKRSHTRPTSEVQTVVEGPISKIKEAQDVLRQPRPPTPPPTKPQDAHEWFLEHYDDVPLHPSSGELAARPRLPPPIPPQAAPVASSSKKQMSTPATMPEAAVALEQELEELVVNSPTIPSKIEPDVDVDMDVDIAVKELVAETLESDVVQHIDVGMEVDVEDELLSLVDDRPSVHHTSRRTSGPATSAMSMLSTKHLPFQVAGSSDVRQDSPSAVSNAALSGNFSPVIRSSSARPSERGSMPPPASVAPARGKDKDEKTERASSVTATAPTAKKKKEGTSKVCLNCEFLLLR
jgi:COMPASS component SPP1